MLLSLSAQKKMSEKGKMGEVIIIPYPAQGHINPALAFAKRLSSKGLTITFIITTSITKSAKITDSPSIAIRTISDGSEQIHHPETVSAYFRRLRTAISADLEKFMDEQRSCPQLIIYDSIMPWVLEIAHCRGLLGAPFFTQSAAANAVYCHLKQGSRLRFPYEEGAAVLLPSFPPLETGDLPSFSHVKLGEESHQIAAEFLANQFINTEKADWIFINTFYGLEDRILSWMESQLPIKTVGPTFLLRHDDDESPDSNIHTISIFEPKHDACREWLDLKQTGSVVYVSLGSLASLSTQQMEELAFGLLMSNHYFLWVVRSSEVDKLPRDFTSLASEKGLVVEWCHQPEVLAHRALACFVSHCGWNSTLEALSYGVPIVAMAQWIDQITNAKFVEDVWRFGIRLKAGENGVISREEIAKCIKEVVDGDGGIELKANACKWKDLANEAMQKGGTSANNIDDFVSKLMCA